MNFIRAVQQAYVMKKKQFFEKKIANRSGILHVALGLRYFSDDSAHKCVADLS